MIEKTDDLQILWAKIKDIKVAMLVSVTAEGGYHSRPMMTAQKEFSGTLYFFARSTSPKVDEILEEPRVLLNYTEPDDSTFIAVYGNARVVTDQESIERHWSPSLKAFFKEGKTDPELCLIEVEVTDAEYWDSHKSKMTQILELAKVVISDSKPRLGHNKKFSVSKPPH